MSEASEQQQKPYLRDDGSVCVPLYGDPKYHYWKEGGQSMETTLLELNAPYETLVVYLGQAAADKLTGRAKEPPPEPE